MRNVVLAVFLAAVPVLTVADQIGEGRPASPQVVRRPSQERLDQIRRSLMAQIAVRDEAEGMRAPSATEAAALTGTVPDGSVVALPGGGVALLTSGAQLSAVVASRSEDGTIRISHGAMAAIASGNRTQGGSHAR